MKQVANIKAIIGLGNPGKQYERTRHNIGFRVLDRLAEKHHVSWRSRDSMEIAELMVNDKKLLLIKPQTFMNSSGQVMPYLTKQGIGAENIMVVHDEIELPFAKLKHKFGGSAKGHNGLKSIMNFIGDEFHRVRFGVDRPDSREDVPQYVLDTFVESEEMLVAALEEAVIMVEEIL